MVVNNGGGELSLIVALEGHFHGQTVWMFKANHVEPHILSAHFFILRKHSKQLVPHCKLCTKFASIVCPQRREIA